MINKITKLYKTDNSKLILIVVTFILLGIVRLGLFALSFQNLQNGLNKIGCLLQNKYTYLKNNSLNEIVHAVNISCRYMPGEVKCLARALTTQVIMQTFGYAPQLKIGVAKNGSGTIEAHAWIECQGKVVIGNLSRLDNFKSLTTPHN